jgi:hypothetical protein
MCDNNLVVSREDRRRLRRRRIAATVFTLTCIASCDSFETEPSQTVRLDGYLVSVEKVAGRNSYFARHLSGQGVGSTDAAASARHIRAIEQVAGCPADPLSISHNPYGYSTAAVNCPA